MNDETIDHRSRSDLKAHTDICTERYGNLWTSISELKSAIQSNHVVANDRLNALSNRMWAALVGVTATAVVSVGIMAFYMLTHK